MVERVICWVAAIAFFLMAVYLARKEKEKWLIGATLIMAFVAFMCSLTWFQGVLKTHIISTVYGTLERYGKKLDEFQETTGKMKTELAELQGAIQKQQKDIEGQQSHLSTAQVALTAQQSNITNHQASLATMQAELMIAQSTLSNQQVQLSDVDYYVKNVFSKQKTEHFSPSDTNRMVRVKMTNGLYLVCFRLKTVAIPYSAAGIEQGVFGRNPASLDGYIGNLVLGKWHGGVPEGISITYVADERNTNVFSSIYVKENTLFADGKVIYASQSEATNAKETTQPEGSVPVTVSK